jgi:hypothetical protein
VDPLEKFESYGLAYEVVRTVEVIVHHERYRIDVLKRYSNYSDRSISYTARCQIQKEIVMRFNGDVAQEVRRAWIDCAVPRSDRDSDTADGALAHALSFLAEKPRRHA